MNSDNTCQICGKAFDKKEYKNRHVKLVHKLNAWGEKVLADKVSCVLCDRQYTSNKSLQRHINQSHFSEGIFFPIYECAECNFKTKNKLALKKHVNNHILGKKLQRRLFNCPKCSSKFSTETNLKNHEKGKHNRHLSKKAGVIRKCPICPFTSSHKRRNEINDHIEKEHNVLFKWDEYSFNNLEQFHEWKRNLEKTTISYYIETTKSVHYVCHRSGNYKYQGSNKRKTKIIGSSKINGFCPSEIKVKVQKNGQVDIKYLPCHVGHKNELKYIPRRIRQEQNKNISSVCDNVIVELEVPYQYEEVNHHYEEANHHYEEANHHYEEANHHYEEDNILHEGGVRDDEGDGNKTLIEEIQLFSTNVLKYVKTPAQIKYFRTKTREMISTLRAMAPPSRQVEDSLLLPNANI